MNLIILRKLPVRETVMRDHRGSHNLLLAVHNRNPPKRNKERFEFVGVLDIEIGILFITNEESCYYHSCTIKGHFRTIVFLTFFFKKNV